MAFSRNPPDYRPDPRGHFRKQKDERRIPGAAIEACIKHGEVVRNEGSRRKLRATVGGVCYWLALDVKEMLAVSCGRCGPSR